jgi:hypothetical protein
MDVQEIKEQLSLLGFFQIWHRILIKIQGTFMSQIQLKFEFHAFGRFKLGGICQ